MWVIDHDWTIVGGVAQAVGVGPGNGTMKQEVGFRRYYRYRVTFTLQNFVGITPGVQGITIKIGGTESALYDTEGTFTYEAVASDISGELQFITKNLDPIDKLELDTLSLEKIDSYLEDPLEILTAEPRISSTYVGVATDYYTGISSKSDNSSCLISYDLP